MSMLPPVFNMRGIGSETFRIVVTDDAQEFTLAQYASNGQPAIAAFITCEDHGVRYCFGGATPTEGGTGLGHVLPANGDIYLNNSQLIQTFSFINEAAQSAAVIQVTMEFEIGTDMT